MKTASCLLLQKVLEKHTLLLFKGSSVIRTMKQNLWLQWMNHTFCSLSIHSLLNQITSTWSKSYIGYGMQEQTHTRQAAQTSQLYSAIQDDSLLSSQEAMSKSLYRN